MPKYPFSTGGKYLEMLILIETYFKLLWININQLINFVRPPWEEVFEEYHHCEKPFHIIHK